MRHFLVKEKLSMKRILSSVAVVFAIIVALTASSCDTGGATTNQQSVDQTNNNDASARLHKAYPYPVLTTSSELKNEIQRYHVLNDDVNRISYVYLMSLDGKIIAEYQIIGKVSSTDSLYSAPVSTDCSGNGVYQGSGSATCATVPSAQPDGSYGQNEPGIYFFINDAAHTMVEWNGYYLWSFSQLYLQQPPDIMVVPNGK